jgi:hypothetical protein
MMGNCKTMPLILFSLVAISPSLNHSQKSNYSDELGCSARDSLKMIKNLVITLVL